MADDIGDAIVQRSSVLPVGRNGRGELKLAVPGMLSSMFQAAQYPGQVYRGEASIRGADGQISDEAVGKSMDLAGTAMTGSLPFGAPKGALRMFGGAAAKDDPFAELEAALAHVAPEAPAPGPRRLDPAASSWDLYHGSNAGPDFKRFDPSASSNPAERGGVFFAPDPQTASGYAATGGAQAGDAGQRVFRTSVEPGKTAVFDLGQLAETDPTFNARARQLVEQHDGPAHLGSFDQSMADFIRSRAEHAEINKQVQAMGYPASAPDGLTMGYGHIGAAVQMAKEQGLDTAILRGIAEHGGDDQVVALTPGRVRSFYAPDQLLYSGGPAGAAVGAGVNAASGEQPGLSRLFAQPEKIR
jgi:hypothetical protein